MTNTFTRRNSSSPSSSSPMASPKFPTVICAQRVSNTFPFLKKETSRNESLLFVSLLLWRSSNHCCFQFSFSLSSPSLSLLPSEGETNNGEGGRGKKELESPFLPSFLFRVPLLRRLQYSSKRMAKGTAGEGFNKGRENTRQLPAPRATTATVHIGFFRR